MKLQLMHYGGLLNSLLVVVFIVSPLILRMVDSKHYLIESFFSSWKISVYYFVVIILFKLISVLKEKFDE